MHDWAGNEWCKNCKLNEGRKLLMKEKQVKLLMTIAGVGILSMLVWGYSGGIAWADDEQVLEKKATTLNSTPASSQNDESRAKALAKQFNVPESRVAEMRNQKMGWGEITISLAMAQHMSATSKTPLTTEQALTKIQRLRSEKMGWGKIAKEEGFKLGPVVSAVDRGEQTLKTADRGAAERSESKASTDLPDKSDKMDRGDRAERPQHPDRPEHPDRPGRAGR
jgi:hypothetical protein